MIVNSRRAVRAITVAAAVVLGSSGAPAHATVIDAYVGFSPRTSVHACTSRLNAGGSEMASICIERLGDRVWGYADYSEARSGAVEVSISVTAYRCRVVDNVCVAIAAASGVSSTGASGSFSATTPQTVQTWPDRYYKACGSVSSAGTGFTLSRCTLTVS